MKKKKDIVLPIFSAILALIVSFGIVRLYQENDKTIDDNSEVALGDSGSCSGTPSGQAAQNGQKCSNKTDQRSCEGIGCRWTESATNNSGSSSSSSSSSGSNSSSSNNNSGSSNFNSCLDKCSKVASGNTSSPTYINCAKTCDGNSANPSTSGNNNSSNSTPNIDSSDCARYCQIQNGSSMSVGFYSCVNQCKAYGSSNGSCSISATTGSRLTSQGTSYSVSVTASGAGCRGKTITHSATNGSVSSASYTVPAAGSYSFSVTVTSGCGSTSIASVSISGGSPTSASVSTADPWTGPTTSCEKNPAYTSQQAADGAGAADYYTNYGACGNGTNGYRSHYHRGCGSSSGGGGEDPSPKTYDFCCQNGNGKKHWVTNQSSRTCPNGETITNDSMAQCSQETRKYDFCCQNGNGKKHWVTDQSSRTCPTGETITNDSKAQCGQETRKYDFCCQEGNGKKHWLTSQSSHTCPNGWTVTNDPIDQCKTPGCYANAQTLSQATDAQYLNDGPSLSLPYLISGASADICKIEKLPPLCTPTNVSVLPTTKNANICEDNITIEQKDGVSCSGASFYSIDCTTTLKTRFDNDDDGEETTSYKSIFQGQGISFGIYITTERTCNATFNKENWLKAYNSVQNVIKQARFENNESLLYEAYSKEEDLKAMVNTYNEYEYSRSYEENGHYVIDYKKDEKPTTMNGDFDKIEYNLGEGKITRSSVVNLGVSGVTNPKNYEWTNKSSPRKVKLLPKATHLNIATGEESETGLEVKGKILMDYNADPGEYYLKMDIGGVGDNNKVVNDKCKILVDKKELLYRPIDVSNPFINSEWKKGENWINSQYDFTKTIHANTWREASLYEIPLPSDVVSSLKSSTNKYQGSNYYPYLGTCDLSGYDRDSVTDYICKIIENKKTN